MGHQLEQNPRGVHGRVGEETGPRLAGPRPAGQL